VLLRSVAYGESDRVVTLLTRAHGKIAALARGARRSKKRFAGALEPFALLRVDVALGGNGMGRLDAATVVRAYPALLRDLARMNAAGAFLTLVRDLLPDGAADEEIFEDVISVLDALEGGEIPEQSLLLTAQAQLLARAGWSPGLDGCGRCGKVPEHTRSADFDPVNGFLVCQSCGGASHRLSALARAALLEATQGNFIEAAAAPWTTEDLEATRRALRIFIDERLERRSDRPSLR